MTRTACLSVASVGKLAIGSRAISSARASGCLSATRSSRRSVTINASAWWGEPTTTAWMPCVTMVLASCPTLAPGGLDMTPGCIASPTGIRSSANFGVSAAVTSPLTGGYVQTVYRFFQPSARPSQCQQASQRRPSPAARSRRRTAPRESPVQVQPPLPMPARSARRRTLHSRVSRCHLPSRCREIKDEGSERSGVGNP